MTNQPVSRRKYLVYLGAAIGVVAISYSGYTYYRHSKKQKTHLRMGYQPSTHHLAYMTAMEKEWWKNDLGKLGVESISEYEFPSGPPEMQAMLAGDLDIAYVGATPPITAIGNGLDAKIIANVNIQGSHLVFSPTINYLGPESLRNLKIGTFPPGSIQDTVLKKWLKNNNIDADVELEIVSMGPGDAVTAMAAQAVDSVFLPHPYPAIIELENTGKMVLGSGSMWQNHPCCCVVMTGDMLRNHVDLVEQVIQTHIKATEYNIAHQEEAAQIFAKKIGWEIEKVQYSLQTWDGQWLYDPHIGKKGILEYAEVHYNLGYIDHPLTEQDLFDTSFYDNITSK